MNTPSHSSDSTTSPSLGAGSRGWHIVRRLVIGLAIFATLIGFFYAVENWRGKHAWQEFKGEWEAKGERFDVAAFIPKPVPPEQNFAMTPVLTPFLDYEYDSQRHQRWKDTNALERTRAVSVSKGSKDIPKMGSIEAGNLTDLREWQKYYRRSTNYPSTPQPQEPARDVLLALSQFDPVMNELRAASLRPYSVFLAHYDEGFSMLVTHLAPLKSLGQVAHLRSAAYLETGQTGEALQDVKLGFRLAESVKEEPIIISHLVRIALLHISATALWEGLAKHRWNEAELEDLQKYLSSIHVLEDYSKSVRGERAFANQLLDQYRSGGHPSLDEISGDQGNDPWGGILKFAPRGWIYQNQLLLNRLHQEHSLRMVDADKHRVHPELSGGLEDWIALTKATPYNVVVRMLFPALSSVGPKFARAQTVVDQATVACALERYRIAGGQYPENLEALVPRFLAKIPTDVINGEPLKYRRIDDGQFVLYSVGWDQKDDGGMIVKRKGKTGRPDIEQGDWVWRYPAT